MPNKKPLNQTGIAENIEQRVFLKKLSELFKIFYMHHR